MRRAAKVDANHRVIVAAFRALGCSVRDGSKNSDGWCDLAVGLLSVTHHVEVKDGSKSPSRRRRTAAQLKWSTGWRGEMVHIVESIEDVQRLVAAWKAHAWHHTPASACPVVPSDVEVDASDYERPHKPGEWLPMPHKDSPSVFSQPADGRCFVTQIIDGRHENRCIRFAGHLGDCAFPTVSR